MCCFSGFRVLLQLGIAWDGVSFWWGIAYGVATCKLKEVHYKDTFAREISGR